MRPVYVFYLHQVPLQIQLDYKHLDTQCLRFMVKKFVYQSQSLVYVHLIVSGRLNEYLAMNYANIHEKIFKVKLNYFVWKLVSLKLNSLADHSIMILNLKIVLSLKWIVILFLLVQDRKKLNDLSCPQLMVPLIIMNLIVLSVSCPLFSLTLTSTGAIFALITFLLSFLVSLFSTWFAALNNYTEWREEKRKEKKKLKKRLHLHFFVLAQGWLMECNGMCKWRVSESNRGQTRFTQPLSVFSLSYPLLLPRDHSFSLCSINYPFLQLLLIKGPREMFCQVVAHLLYRIFSRVSVRLFHSLSLFHSSLCLFLLTSVNEISCLLSALLSHFQPVAAAASKQFTSRAQETASKRNCLFQILS